MGEMTHVVALKVIIPRDRLTILPSAQQPMRFSLIIRGVKSSVHFVGIGDAILAMRSESQ